MYVGTLQVHIWVHHYRQPEEVPVFLQLQDHALNRLIIKDHKTNSLMKRKSI